MSKKYALVIANTEYTDSGFSQLSAPGKDADEFVRILESPDIAAFDNVSVILNENASQINEKIEDFFSSSVSEDLLIFYFSGHGIRDEYGSLYLAVKNTNRSKLRSTAIKSDFIREAMDRSRSNRQILILDCCNSGAFSYGTKAEIGGGMGTSTAFEGTGYGRVVLTASDATQFAWEGDKVIGETSNSLFTHFLIKGMEGEADKDKDGKITVDDLYEYAYEKIVRLTPKQTPGKWSYKQQGEIVLRELSEAQKEQLRNYKLLQEQKLAQERADEAAREKQERKAIEMETSRLISERAVIEEEMRETMKKNAQEKAKFEFFEKNYQGISTQSYVPEGIGIKKEAKIFTKLNVAAFVGLGLLIFVITVIFLQFSGKLSIPTAPLIFPLTSQARPTTQALEFTPGVEAMILEGTPLPQLTQSIGVDNADRIVSLVRLGKGAINHITYSPDEKNIAVASAIGIYIYNATTLQEIRFISTDREIVDVSFSTNEKTLIAFTDHGDVLNFQVNDGTFINGIKGDLNYIRYTSLLPDKNLLAVLDNGNMQVTIYNTQDGSLLKSIEIPEISASLQTIKISPSGDFLAGGVSDGHVYLWDLSNGKIIKTFDEESSGYDRFSAVDFSSDDRFIAASSSQSGLVTLWNVDSGQVVQSFEGHSDVPVSLAFSADGGVLTYGLSSGLVRSRNTSDGSIVSSIQLLGAGNVDNYTFLPNGNFISTNGTSMSLWNINSEKAIKTLDGFSNYVNNVSVSLDGKFLASGSTYSHVWDIKNTISIQTFSSNSSFGNSAIFSRSEMALALKSNNIASFWQFADNKTGLTKIKEIDMYSSTASIMAFSPNTQTFAVSDYAEDIDLWNIRNEQSKTLAGHTKRVETLVYSPDGKLLASGSDDNTIRLWNIPEGTTYKVLEKHLSIVDSVAFSPNGKVFASGSEDGTIILWNIEDGSVIKTIELPSLISASSLSFSPNGELLTAGTFSGTIYLWQVSDGKLLGTLTGHTGSVTGLDYSPDGNLLVSSSYDGTIRFWGVTQ